MKLLKYILLAIVLGSCTNVRQIGKVNMISNRNIDSDFEYQRLKTYAGLSYSEIKGTRSESIEQAIDETVKSVPGGEFVMNAKIFVVKNAYYLVEGDVWGVKTEEYRGFKVGDKVQWREMFKDKTGVLKSFVDFDYCMVKIDGEDKTIKLSYEVLDLIDRQD